MNKLIAFSIISVFFALLTTCNSVVLADRDDDDDDDDNDRDRDNDDNDRDGKSSNKGIKDLVCKVAPFASLTGDPYIGGLGLLAKYAIC